MEGVDHINNERMTQVYGLRYEARQQKRQNEGNKSHPHRQPHCSSLTHVNLDFVGFDFLTRARRQLDAVCW